jgi:CubicO group peptidase (beta-lactamase class C family)
VPIILKKNFGSIIKTTVLVGFLLGAITSINGQDLKRIDGSKITSSALTQKIDELMLAANVSGVSVSIFNNRKTVYSKTFGYANVPEKIPLTKNSELYAASFAKTVFAYIAAQLQQERLFDLDTPLVKYLERDLTDYDIKGWNRGYKDLKGDERYKKITARMCLTHTTGFPNWRWFESDKKLKFKFDPGTRYNYSGEGLYLLQFVIEQLTSKDYETICKERVFKPLGMEGTSMLWQKSFENQICYGHNDKGMPYELMKWKEASCAGSMTTTPDDFNKFFTALINDKGLKKKTFDLMVSKQISIRSMSQFGPLSLVDSTTNDQIELGYGLGLGVFKTPFGKAFFKEGHDDGWGHYSVYFPDKRIGIVIMTNNDNGESIFKDLLEYAIADTFTPWKWENYIPYYQR